MNISGWFEWGMNRELGVIPRLSDHNEVLELGGNSELSEYSLMLPWWNAEKDNIPYLDGQMDMVIACHFLEHVYNTGRIMREIERVLMPGGYFVNVVPYYRSALAFQDPDHKRFFTEETFQYFTVDAGGKAWDGKSWKFEIASQFILGIVERNLALFTALRRVE